LLPNDHNHNCFGCNPNNEAGLKMEFYTNKETNAVYSWLTIPDHVSGWANIVHGGIITTILDEAMGWTSLLILKEFFLTKTLTTDFFQPVYIGQEICVVGFVSEFKNDREVTVQAAIYDSNGRLAARASSNVILFELEQIRETGMFDDKFLNGIGLMISGSKEIYTNLFNT